MSFSWSAPPSHISLIPNAFAAFRRIFMRSVGSLAVMKASLFPARFVSSSAYGLLIVAQ
jgi:hypothetical protein